MKKHILMTIDSLKNPGKYSTEELKKNAKDAYADAAYAAAAYDATAYATERWLDKYFELSGENRADYEDALLSEFEGKCKTPCIISMINRDDLT